jgi:hypothetical protein
MSSSRNNTAKYLYVVCFFLFLIVLSLIFTNNFYSGSGALHIFPNLALAGLVYISAYLDIYSGWLAVYVLFYIYGSMTPLNPAVFGFAGTVSYAFSYVLWRKISNDNAVTEIIITFATAWVYYIVLFLVVFYYFDMHFIYWNFTVTYAVPVSVSTAVFAPAVFYFFKKIGFKIFLKKNKLLYL